MASRHRAPQAPIQVQADCCRDCQACALACSLYHERGCGPSVARLAVLKDMARYQFQIVICQHCPDPDCLVACPSGAMRLDERGVVLIDDTVCTRCGRCSDACPYGAILYHEATDRYLKCDLCEGREAGPLCVALCPVGALTSAPTGEEG